MSTDAISGDSSEMTDRDILNWQFKGEKTY